MLNQSNTQEQYNSSSSKMNESKSLDTIRSILDSPTYHLSGKFECQNRKNSLELDEDKNDDLMMSNASNSIIKASSSSSSKTGSNKNSLHGSIETMIEVS